MNDELLKQGRESYSWARHNMPAVLLAESAVKKKKRLPFKGLLLAASLHVSKETAVLLCALKNLGLSIKLAAANPLSSQSDIVAYLNSEGIEVNAKREESISEYNAALRHLARSEPDLIVDDGGQLHVEYWKSKVDSCFGGTDETTSGTHRLRALDARGELKYPVIVVNEAKTKYLFDNRYGTGQSSIDGVLRATDALLAGKVVVVAGYGWVGKGVAMRARGFGSRVIVTEVSPLRATEAYLDGYDVMPMQRASSLGDIFLTCTGQTDAISKEHFLKMKNGAVVGNCGHFDTEINVRQLVALSSSIELVRANLERYNIGKSKAIYLLCQGRVVNLVAGEGHPPEIMQFSFANQLLCLDYLVSNRSEIARGKIKLLSVPEQIDDLVSEFALRCFRLDIDKLSAKQKKYGWSFIR
jgi:adenosylhomocysteinase